MKKISLLVPSLLLMTLPLAASAHEMATYKIGNSAYQIVIGSLNEPIAVDDKTGLDLTITKCNTSACAPTMGPDGDMDGPAGAGVTGLENSLKLELSAGNQKKTLAITPAYGVEGGYRAPFYFTVPTTVSYRIFGTIAGTQFDQTFACVPAGTPKAANDTTEKKISNGVTQTSIEGGFTCPTAKADLGFPEAAPSLIDLQTKAESSGTTGMWGIGLGAIGIALAGFALFRRRA